MTTELDHRVLAAWPVARERAKDIIRAGHKSGMMFSRMTVIDILALSYLSGVSDMVETLMKMEKVKRGGKELAMKSRDYELTDEQYTQIQDALPRVADLALAYLVSDLPRDSFFDGWAGGMVACADTSSWGDEAMNLAMTDSAEKYERFVCVAKARHVPFTLGEIRLAAEARGALLRAGALFLALHHKFVPEATVIEGFAVAFEKLSTAVTKLKQLGIEV